MKSQIKQFLNFKFNFQMNGTENNYGWRGRMTAMNLSSKESFYGGRLYQCARAAITKPRLEGIPQQKEISHSSRGWKSKFKVPTALSPGLTHGCNLAVSSYGLSSVCSHRWCLFICLNFLLL